MRPSLNRHQLRLLFHRPSDEARLPVSSSSGALTLAAALLLLPLPSARAQAPMPQTQLIQNGGFESNGGYGTSALTGWTTATSMSPQTSTAGFFVGDNTQTQILVGQDANGNDIVLNTPTTPVNGLPTAGAKSGNFYAVSDSDGAASSALLQRFTVPLTATQVTLSFSMFVNARNGAGALNASGTLDYAQSTATQFARVDLLSANASAFSLGAGNVLRNFYTGVDPIAGPNPLYPTPYTTYSFNLTGVALPGQSYQIRFADVSNRLYLNTGVDNVSVLAVGPAANAPEPGSLPLLGMGLMAGLDVVGIPRRHGYSEPKRRGLRRPTSSASRLRASSAPGSTA